METNAQNRPEIEHSNAQPTINNIGQNDEPLTDANNPGTHKKKYHSSAMYAANVWHSTMQHVKQHQNHTGINLAG